MKINRILYSIFFLFFFSAPSIADSIPTDIYKQTVEFAQRDSTVLKMDIYRMQGTEGEKQPVMFFVFGGSFKRGSRDQEVYHHYFHTLPTYGITTISIDYRLGLVGRKLKLFNTSAADDAINMAVEDLYSATRYVLQHADELGVDTTCIMLSGSSAGAITVLQADYYLHNQMPLSEMLREDFTYKGVVAFAGAIFSHEGTPDYETSPAPTLFFHGDRDKVVFYSKLRLFRRGLFGSKSLAKRFKKRGYNYLFLTMEDKAHTVAVTPMNDQLDLIHEFIQHYVYEQKNWQVDTFFKDQDSPPDKKTTLLGMLKKRKNSKKK